MQREHQETFLFDYDAGPIGDVPDPLTDYFMDVAGAWDVPLGQRVRVRLRDPALPELEGKLRLVRAPDFPLDPRQPLALCLCGVEFMHREIASWTLT